MIINPQLTSGRMQALAVANALMSTNNAIGAMAKGWGGDTVDKMGGVSLNLSYGSSSSESSSTQTYSRAQGSNVSAGGNINIVATGNDDHRVENEPEHEDNSNSLSNAKRGNITLQGSNIKAGKDTSLEAERNINLLAAKNTAEQHSTNSSSSGSVGVGYGFSSKGGGLSGTLSASSGRGHADGSDVNWTSAHVDAGNTLTLKSGRDTNLKGAVASGKQVNADIGGNLNIQSLQDTSVYDSQQKSEGGSVTVGAGAGASVNLSKSNINSNYASVVEQSGIKAGDSGYKVKVKGNTDLKGAVIAASDEGLTQSTFATGGTLTQSDIQNSADYNAEAYAVSVGVGSKASASAGLGEDSGHASSTTKSGIGVSTKTDTTGAIAKIFDANKVTEEVNAQVQITQSFSQLAPKAVGDYAGSKTRPYTDAKEYQALNQRKLQGDFSEAEQKRLSELEQQGMSPQQAQATLDDPQVIKDYNNWKEGGTHRVALHTLVGTLYGGVDSAVGAATTAATTPEFAKRIDELDVPVEVKKALNMAAGTAIGYATGGNKGAASGLTQVANNFLAHGQQERRAELRKKLMNGKATISEARELMVLEQADQISDELFWKWKANPDSLKANEKTALAGYLNVYAAQAGEVKFKQLMGPSAMMSGAFSGYDYFPYAGSDNAKDAYMDKHDYGWINRRSAPGTNEELYYDARGKVMVNDVHQGQAGVGTPALMFAQGPVGMLANFTLMAQGGYQVGQGAGALDNGEYGTAAWDIGLGSLTMAGAKYGMGLSLGKGVEASKTPLAYDISKWGEYGLPSDGVFSRTLTAEQYRAYKTGREFDFSGKPWAEGGYPNGMGFVGAAEDARGLTSASSYREGLKLEYSPKYVLEFQLRETTGLQNALKAPYAEFVAGGKTGAELREWNFPGISSKDITNSKVRVLK